MSTYTETLSLEATQRRAAKGELTPDEYAEMLKRMERSQKAKARAVEKKANALKDKSDKIRATLIEVVAADLQPGDVIHEQFDEYVQKTNGFYDYNNPVPMWTPHLRVWSIWTSPTEPKKIGALTSYHDDSKTQATLDIVPIGKKFLVRRKKAAVKA